MSAAARLDAADGVIDGRFFGRPIVQGGAPQFGGIQQFGAPQFVGAPTVGIQQFGGIPQQFTAPQFVGAPTAGFGIGSNAAALDAADGVIDGRHFGRPIVQAAAPSVIASGFPTTFGAGFPTTVGFGAQQFGGSSNAAALDAADGVIDGRFFGRQIVQAGAPQFGGIQQLGGISQFGGLQQFGGVPQFGATQIGTVVPQFGATQIGTVVPQFGGIQQFGGVPQFGGAQFGGVPQFGATQFGGVPQFGAAGGAAARLDAADGVLDGRFFGRPIAQASPLAIPHAPRQT